MNNILQDILFVVLTAILPILVRYAVKMVNEVIEENAITRENEIITDTVGLIGDIVISVNQTFTDSLKADGTFTKEDGVKAFNKARNQALTLINDEAKEIIEERFSNLEDWLKVEIESFVNQYKAEKVD